MLRLCVHGIQGYATRIEWKRGVCWLKVDLAKAFDRVDRRVLANRLLQKLGMCPEYRCWYNLLRNTDAVLQTDWNSTVIDLHDGIKQGAIESPAFFSFLAETCLHEAAARFEWHKQGDAFQGLSLNNLLYMDDGLMWSRGTYCSVGGGVTGIWPTHQCQEVPVLLFSLPYWETHHEGSG